MDYSLFVRYYPLLVEVSQGLIHGDHTVPAADLDHGVDLVGFPFTDQVANGWGSH